MRKGILLIPFSSEVPRREEVTEKPITQCKLCGVRLTAENGRKLCEFCVFCDRVRKDWVRDHPVPSTDVSGSMPGIPNTDDSVFPFPIGDTVEVTYGGGKFSGVIHSEDDHTVTIRNISGKSHILVKRFINEVKATEAKKEEPKKMESNNWPRKVNWRGPIG